MLTREQGREIKNLLEQPTPVASLYLDINPAKPDNTLKAVLLRARNALGGLEIPQAVVVKVLTKLEELPTGRSQIVIAGEDFLKSWSLQIELPLVEGVEARWGEVYLAPLLYALDEFERFGVVWLSSDKARLFEVFLGEIEELPGAFQAVNPAQWKQLSNDSVGRGFSAGMRARGGTATDHFEQRMGAWSQRFYKRLAGELEEWVEVRGLTRLLLMGPQRDTDAFATGLPRWLRERVVDKLGGPAHHITPATVLKVIAASIEQHEHRREAEMVQGLVERGVGGLDQVLQLLQQGRLQMVVAPWRTSVKVYQSADGQVFPGLLQAKGQRPGQPIREVSLKDVLPELAFARGSQLGFVRGEAETRLMDQLGGLGGIER